MPNKPIQITNDERLALVAAVVALEEKACEAFVESLNGLLNRAGCPELLIQRDKVLIGALVNG